jgi:ABC-type antimicrobial peptide transport system permease subunit
MSYKVALRVQEIGIRMALGAERRDVLRMVIAQGLGLTVAGLLIGAVGALLLARLLSSFSRLLYGVRTSDPLTFMAVSLVLVGVSVLASYFPARRASHINPWLRLDANNRLAGNRQTLLIQRTRSSQTAIAAFPMEGPNDRPPGS